MNSVTKTSKNFHCSALEVIFSTRDFQYSKNDHTLTAEASTLSQGGTRPIFGALWPDLGAESQIGLVLKSHMTGKIAKFAISQQKHDSDGDLVSHELSPLSLGDIKITGNLKIIIFND